MSKKRLVEETHRIEIGSLRDTIDSVYLTDQPVEGYIEYRGEEEALRISKPGDIVILVIGDRTIELDGDASLLVPGAVARWYFVCPDCSRRCKALYRPTMDDEFSCRECHDLTYLSSQEQHKYEALYKAIGEEMNEDWKTIRVLCDMMVPGWESK
jgi:hypothetical protein